ncbi:MAG: hypothetical protein ABMB14_34955 [Myxococcota bacterium]
MARRDPIAHLSRHPDGPPPRLVAEILALGPAGITALLAIVAERTRWTADEVTVVNAIEVLTAASALEVVPTLLAIVAEVSDESDLYRSAILALQELARPALVEPVLAEPVGTNLTLVLSRCGVRDPRIAERIEALLAVDGLFGAVAATAYGDPAHAPLLNAALDRVLEDAELVERLDETDALIHAILRLGGPEDALRARGRLLMAFDRWQRIRDAEDRQR